MQSSAQGLRPGVKTAALSVFKTSSGSWIYIKKHIWSTDEIQNHSVLRDWENILIPRRHALTHFTFKHIAVSFSSSLSVSFQCSFSLKKQCTCNVCLQNQGLSGCLWKGCSVVPICVVFHPLLINLPPFADGFVSSTRNRFQLFMPIFNKYLGDGISKQTMPGDTNPRLQQRSFNALEIGPAVDRHLLLSSAALQQQCWLSKYVYRSSAALTLHRRGAGIILKERRKE